MIPGSANPLLLASAVQAGGYVIDRSLRFNAADSAYLSRTPSTAGNRKTWTWTGWVKRTTSSASGQSFLFGTFDVTGSNGTLIHVDVDNIGVKYAAGGLYLINSYTSAVLRDFSAWYHITVVFDTTQAVQSSRLKIYLNGVQQTLTGVTWNQNTDYGINASGTVHGIGRSGQYNGFYLNAYLADIHFIDGQALDPTSFGEFDTNGIWQPIEYTGTYGTNGFHLTFSDNSTAGSLGDDSSGNGNDWTVNNISVATGAGNDSLVDVPTNGTETDTGLGGEVKGNYATWNPLVFSLPALSNGNLDTIGDSTWKSAFSTIKLPASGKWYWEITAGTNVCIPGIAKQFPTTNTYIGNWADSYGWYGAVGNKVEGPSYTQTSYASFADGDLIGVAYDAGAGSLTFYKNGVSQGVAFSGLSGEFYPVLSTNGGITMSANFGQRPFAYTAPSGFKALCTANLPSTTITTSGSYTGNGVADGPFVYLNGVPTAMTVNGNAVTFGANADKLSNGFKIRTTSTTFNQNASTYNYSITSTGDPFKTARAQAN